MTTANDNDADRLKGARKKKGRSGYYWYFYPGKDAKPIPLGPDSERQTPEFMARFRNARDGVLMAKAMPGQPVPAFVERDERELVGKSFRWLVRQYFKGADFLSLSAHGQGTRQTLLEEICNLPWPAKGCTFGDLTYSKMTAEHFEHIRDNARTNGVGRMAGTTVRNVGATYIKYASIVFCWGIAKKTQTGCVYNPCFRLGRTTEPEGYRWSEAECVQFEDRHAVGTMARLAYELLRWLGSRRSCAIRLGANNVNDGILKFYEWKGSQSKCVDPRRRQPPKLHVEPMPADLAQIIRLTKGAGHGFWLLDDDGRPFTDSGIGYRFKQWVIEAGLPHKSQVDPTTGKRFAVSCMPHGLRRRAALDLKRAGGGFEEAQRKFGWTNHAQWNHYTKEETNSDVAASATARMAETRRKARERLGVAPATIVRLRTKKRG